MRTSELTGAALDWAVAKCEGHDAHFYGGVVHTTMMGRFGPECNYSTDWRSGGPIIERDQICIFVRNATWPDHQRWSARPNTADGDSEFGPTPLIAAMRCYVASKLGDNVDIPKELMQ